MSVRHFIDALVGTTLKQAGLTLPKYWKDRMVKAVRKVLLFDAERKKLCAWMDSEHIWYLPLKGIILKGYYPSVGMRQMLDNDILFDADAWERVEKHMLSEGYETESLGKGNHDVYQKPPVYNFEMHRSLYGKGHDESWVEYYSDIKERLIPAYWCYRIVRLLFSKKRRDYMLREVKTVEKAAVHKNNTEAK